MRNIVTGYQFNKLAKTVTFPANFSPPMLERILLIVDQTAGVIIFDPSTAGKGGVLAQNVLTLTLDTTGASYANSDVLQIFVDDGNIGATEQSLSKLLTAFSESFATEQEAEQLNTPIINTGNDEPLELVGLHPNYPLPIDTSTPMPVAGKTPTGAQAQLQVNEQGGVVLADCPTLYSEPRGGNGQLQIIDTLGYGAAVIQLVGSWSAQINFQSSNDLTNWVAATGYPITPGTALVTFANAPGIWFIPTSGRYLRLSIISWASGAVRAITVLRAQSPMSTPSVNLGYIGGFSAVNSAGILNVVAAGTTVVGSAPTANPVPGGGWDGTLTRRLLLDASGNTQVAGTSANAGFATGGPVQDGVTDQEGRVRRMSGDVLGRVRVVDEESGNKDDGVIDSLNNIVRELRLLNNRLADLPYYLGANKTMPPDELSFRDDVVVL